MIHRTPCLVAALATSLALTGTACAPKQIDGFDRATITVVETEALAGAALSQRKREMTRAVADMQAFYETMEGMLDRRDRESTVIFSEFVMDYITRHLDKLLEAGWQSSHPELIEIDANLRVLEAGVLVQLRKPERLRSRVADTQKRFRGRESLLISAPNGDQASLGEILHVLQTRMGECLDSRTQWGKSSATEREEGDLAETICMGPA